MMNLKALGALTLLILIMLLGSASEVQAQNYIFENGLHGGQITSAEWKMLPEYCIDTQGYKYGRGGSPNSEKWVSLLGDTFWDLHHYCLAIVEFNRGQRIIYDPNERRGFLESAVSDFQYVVQHMPERYVLAPEIYTYLGRTYLLLKTPNDADSAFARARALKPDYWPAYSWWASYLIEQGRTSDARAIVTEGLKHAPASRTLQLIKRDLDSKGAG